MAVIDSEGLFAGIRMGLLKDAARLHFPWLLVASNGFGRIEVNYNGIVARVYQGFSRKPTQEELFGWIQEYHAAGLLFLYQCGGQCWGMWDTRPELLPRFKTARDKRSPAPPEPDFSNWKRLYREQSKAVPKSIGNLSEVLRRDFVNTSAPFPSGGGIGVGVGTGIGDGKTLCSSDDERGASILELSPLRSKPSDEIKEWFDALFWRMYPRRVGKPQALKAARRHGKTAGERAAIMACLEHRLPALREQFRGDGDFRPYPASWLNSEPWSDQSDETEKPAKRATRDGDGGITEAIRMLNDDRGNL
jgi:hypothetical protein